MGIHEPSGGQGRSQAREQSLSDVLQTSPPGREAGLPQVQVPTPIPDHRGGRDHTHNAQTLSGRTKIPCQDQGTAHHNAQDKEAIARRQSQNPDDNAPANRHRRQHGLRGREETASGQPTGSGHRHGRDQAHDALEWWNCGAKDYWSPKGKQASSGSFQMQEGQLIQSVE